MLFYTFTTLAYSTAVDGQCYKDGLTNLEYIMKSGPDRQDGFFCSYPKGLPSGFSPLNKTLGVTSFVDPYDGMVTVPSSEPGIFDNFAKDGRPRGQENVYNGAFSGGFVWHAGKIEQLYNTKVKASVRFKWGLLHPAGSFTEPSSNSKFMTRISSC